MPIAEIPERLRVDVWRRQLPKLIPYDPPPIGDALKQLERLHEAANTEPPDEDDADALVRQAAEVAEIAARWLRSAKKGPRVPAALVELVRDVGEAADDFGDDLREKREERERTKRTAAALAGGAGADSADDAGPVSPASKAVRGRVISRLRLLRSGKLLEQPLRFMVLANAEHCAVYVAASVSPSHRPMLARLLPDGHGAKVHLGECLWANNAITFFGETLPVRGMARRLQEALTALTGKRWPVRVSRLDGEADEAEGDDDDDDDDAAADLSMPPAKSALPLVAGRQAPPELEAARISRARRAEAALAPKAEPGEASQDMRFRQAWKAIQPHVKALIERGHPRSDLMSRLQDARDKAGRGSYGEAAEVLGEIHAMARAAKPASP